MKKRKIKRIVAALGCTVVILVTAVLGVSAAPLLDDSITVGFGYESFIDYAGLHDVGVYEDYVSHVKNFVSDKPYTYQGYIMGLEYLSFGAVNVDYLYYPFDALGADISISGVIDYVVRINGSSFSSFGCEALLFSVPSADSFGIRLRSRSIDDYDDYRDIYIGYTAINSTTTPADLPPYYGQVTSVEVVDFIDGVQSQYVRFNRLDIEEFSVLFTNGTSWSRDFLSVITSMLLGSDEAHYFSPIAYYNGYYQGAIDLPYFYDAGYQQAVAEIDSGKFGKNILGGVFSTPFEMLREFTLIEWTMPNGAEVSVTLATVISAAIGVALFIWFLKLFAGG